MSTARLAISLSAELEAEIREAAESEGVPISRWLAAAAAERLRHRRLGEAIDAYEAEFGPVPGELLEEVDRKWPDS